MRSHNASIVANLAWDHAAGISRAEIARQAGLSASTVSAIVTDLLASELLTLSHIAQSQGGRPPAVLRFNPRRNHIIGLEMGSSHVSAVLCDLCGVLKLYRFEEWDVPGDPEGTLRLIGKLVEEGQRHPEAHGSILGIGIGVPSPGRRAHARSSLAAPAAALDRCELGG